jgi:cutinase
MNGGSGEGATDVVRRLQEQAAACPQEKFALVGYSQGASVMHQAAAHIPAAIQERVVAMVMFGDPGLKSASKFPALLQGRTLENCAVGDYVSGVKKKIVRGQVGLTMGIGVHDGGVL